MAAGNLICASPPYLISYITEVEHAFMAERGQYLVLLPEKGPGGPL